MSSTLRSSDGRVIVPERLRRRRVEVRRGQGRRRLRRVVAFAGLALVLAGGWAVLRSPLLAVDKVVVTGSDHVDRAQVTAATGIGKGGAMMDVSPGRAQDQLAALPWVEHATVSREWPNSVRVRITDRKPVAQVASGSSFALVDADGRVLQTGVGRVARYPLLAGRKAPEPGKRMHAVGPLLKTAEAVPAAFRDRVDDISFADDGSVALTLQGDAVVTLGRPQAFGKKFASLTTVLDHVGSLDKGCTLDVSVPLSPTLTPEYGCA